MTPDRFTFPTEIKATAVAQTGLFQGYASTFHNTDHFGDVIAPGAFAKTLASDRVVALLWNHLVEEPIGRWLRLAEDRHGLAAEGKLTLGTRRGSEALALMRDGALGLSIGFRIAPNGAQYVNGRRVLREVELHEISVTALPANAAARVTSVKNIRDFETALRDELGFSRSEAKRLASCGWKALDAEDQASEELTQIAALLKQTAAHFLKKG